MPPGCTGGGIWGSPVVDASQDTLYVATGNPNENVACPLAVDFAPALLELRTSDLSLVDAWQVPEAEQIVDSDFGSTPNLFVTAAGDRMVGVANKNGMYYAFRRDALSDGPVWQDVVADGSVPLLPPGGLPMVYSTGLATGQLLAAARGVPGERYILCDGHLSFRELAETAVRLAGRGRVPAVMPVRLAKALAAGGEVVSRAIRKPPLLPKGQLHFFLWDARPQSGKAQRELGWVPTPLEDGLRAAVSAFG